MAGPDSQSLRRGWTFWGWLCPIVSLWFPARTMADIYRASSPWGRRHAVLVICWWPPLVASVVLFALVLAVQDMATMNTLFVAAVACEAVAAVLAIVIIRLVGKRQGEYQVANGVPIVKPFA
jgi:hypothetical protein